MSEPGGLPRAAIPERLMLIRLAQSEQMREFFVQMWIQNPALARQGGSKVQDLPWPLAAGDAKEMRSAPEFPRKEG
jgi:hypothetical protein